jgi:hypothetical protein
MSFHEHLDQKPHSHHAADPAGGGLDVKMIFVLTCKINTFNDEQALRNDGINTKFFSHGPGPRSIFCVGLTALQKNEKNSLK